MGARAYCDRDHPGSDAEADDWCARYHRVTLPRTPTCYCRRCLIHDDPGGCLVAFPPAAG